MCYIDLDPCEVWDETVVKAARKLHRCHCCGGPILPSKPYVKHFFIIDGQATFEKMCMTCDRMSKRFQDDHGQRSNPSFMPELLADCISEDDDGSKKWLLETLNMNRRRARWAKYKPEQAKEQGE